MSSVVLFWYLRISCSARVPGLYRCLFLTNPVVDGRALSRRGALPPVVLFLPGFAPDPGVVLPPRLARPPLILAMLSLPPDVCSSGALDLVTHSDTAWTRLMTEIAIPEFESR